MKRTLKLRKLIVGFAGAAALLLLVISAFAAYEVDRHASDLAWSRHSDVVLDLLHESRLEIKIAELARQAFLTTGAASSRDDVRRAAESVRSNAEALQQLTAGDPSRAARAEELATLSAALRSSVETRANRGSPRRGAPAFKRAEILTTTMEVEEKTLQDDRDRREQRSINFALNALGAEVVFALLLAAAALRIILRNLDDRERLLQSMERTVTQLQPRSSDQEPPSS